MAPPPKKKEATKELIGSSRDTRRLLQEQFLDLDSRLQGIRSQIDQGKEELLMNTTALKIFIEENTVMKVNWKQIPSLCNKLKMEFPSYKRDLQKYMGSLIREDEQLRAISKKCNRSKKAKLIAGIDTLHKKTLRLFIDLTQAEIDEEWLCSNSRLLEEKHNQLLLEEKRNQLLFTMEIFEGDNSISSRPTKKPKLEEDARRSIEKAIYVEDSSDGTPPHSPEFRMQKIGTYSHQV